MAKSKKREDEAVEVQKPSIKTKEFKLKRAYQGKDVGASIAVGPRGEKLLKSQNII